MTVLAQPSAGGVGAPAPLQERIAQGIVRCGLALLGFFLLFSTAGTSIAMGLVLIGCCLAPRQVLARWPGRDPLVVCGLLLLAWIALRTLAFDSSATWGRRMVNHYHELLMLPVTWAVMRWSTRPQSFANGLMLGAVAAAASIWITYLQLWPAGPDLPDLQSVFSDAVLQGRRISLGFGLSVCAFLIFEHTRLGRLPRLLGYAGAAFLAATVVFAGEGRTGHVLLLLLIVCAGYRAAPRAWRFRAALGVLALSVLLGALSGPVRTRALETVRVLNGMTPSLDAPELSTAIRLELVHTGLAVARDHWLLGTGWARYRDEYRRAALARDPAAPERPGAQSDNPHNEYLMQLGAGGVPALALFLAWLAYPLWRAARESRPEHPWAGAAGCVALAFAVSALFNSVLLDFVEAHLYAALMAWLMARRFEQA